MSARCSSSARRARTVRLDDGSTAKGYKVEDFADAFARYLPSTPVLSVTSVTTAQLSQKQAVSIRHTDPLCDGYEEGENPHGYADVTDVTDRTPYTGDGAEETRLDECYKVGSEEPAEEAASGRPPIIGDEGFREHVSPR